ncbi:8513_t:CDS:1, partial [Paraglomus occultum]
KPVTVSWTLFEPTFIRRSGGPRHRSHHQDKKVIWEIEMEKIGLSIWPRRVLPRS